MPKLQTRLTNVKNPQERTQNNLNRTAVEDYLKAIYLLQEEKSPVSTSRIADARQVKAASVTNMIQRLAKMELVHYQKYDGVTLTEAGQQCALEMLRHHRIIELYLIEALNFGWEEVHDQAEVLEHVISEEMEERMAAALGYPSFGAYGRPIPTRQGELEVIEAEPLTEISANTMVTVAYIADDTNRELLTCLAEKNILPGTTMCVIEKVPISGSVILKINNKFVVLESNSASMVRVKIASETEVQ